MTMEIHGGQTVYNGHQSSDHIRQRPKTHTCEVIKTAEQVRQERQKEQLMKVAQMIYDGVKSGSYSVENVAEAIMYIR